MLLFVRFVAWFVIFTMSLFLGLLRLLVVGWIVSCVDVCDFAIICLM